MLAVLARRGLSCLAVNVETNAVLIKHSSWEEGARLGRPLAVGTHYYF